MRLFLTLILAIGILLPVSQASSYENSMLGKAAPRFTLKDINHKDRRLSEWRGKLVIVNFWATWCIACKKEIPLLNAFHRKYAGKGLSIVGIAIDHWAAVKQYNIDVPIDYVNLIGKIDASFIVKRYGDIAGALPYSVVIDPEGKIVSISPGLLTQKYLDNIVEKFLKKPR